MSPESSHLPVPNQFGYKAASRYLFGPYLKSRRVDTYGAENLPQGNAPYILAVKHLSLLDIPVIGQVMLEHDNTQLHFVAKKELWKRKLLAAYFDSTGVIKYDRDKKMNQQPEVVDRMNHVLQNNGVLLMFPEHTRREGPEVQITKKGLGMLAVGNLVSIATAGIHYANNPWGRITVNIGRTVEIGPISSDNRRQRMVEMEREYTHELQQAVYGAYELGGEPLSGLEDAN